MSEQTDALDSLTPHGYRHHCYQCAVASGMTWFRYSGDVVDREYMTVQEMRDLIDEQDKT